MHSFLFLIFQFAFIFLNAIEIEKLTIQVIKEYSHDPKCFTQGLAIVGHQLYESSGLYGLSHLKKWDLETGQMANLKTLPAKYFAEGLAHCGDRIILITWKENQAFVLDPHTFSLKNNFHFSGQGWGLCFDGRFLWMSDGSAKLVCRNLDTFEIERALEVKLQNKPCQHLNDLVCVDDAIYANVWLKEEILRIDKQSGQVTGIIDASLLLSKEQKTNLPMEAILNGITYRPETKTFFLTGKYWPRLFEVQFIKKE